LTLIAVLAGFFLWQISRIHVFQFSNDEGILLMWARLARAGYPLYTQTVANQPPGLIMLLMVAFALFGESVIVARTMSLLLSTLGLMAVALIARELGGWPAAVASALLLSVSPLFHWYSLPIMQGVPAFSLAAVSLVLALTYRRSKMRVWLWLSGLAFGLSFVVKLITLPLLAPIGLALLAFNWHERKLKVRPALLDGLVWVSGAILPVGLVLLLFNISAMIPQVLGSIGEARRGYDWSVKQNLAEFGELLLEGNWGLMALGLTGVIEGIKRPSVVLWVVLVWIVVATVALLIHAPLWSHHFILPLIPVTILAGAGAGSLVRTARAWRFNQSANLPIGLLVLSLLAAVIYLTSIPDILRTNLEKPSRFEPIKWQALATLRKFTEPGDFVVSDMGMMIFRAGLLCPPTLADLSEKRIKSGLLTDRDVLEATFQYPVKAIVFWSSRQYLLPDYVAWVEHNYRHVFQDGRSRHVYVPYEGGPIVRYPQPSQLQDGVTLVGYSLAKPSVRAGEELHLTLFWEARQPVSKRYIVFAHLVDATGKIWGQKESLPGGGTRPTDSWQPGVLIVDNYAIPVDAGAPTGSYQLEVGMYDAASGQRLLVLDAQGHPQDHGIVIKPILVNGG